MNELNSHWLKSFTVLCEERNFTRAAKLLNMTQPGMSQHVAKLEQQIGTGLIDRDAPGFVLTDAGEKTLTMARARWREECDFLESLGEDDEDRGQVSVATSGSFAMLLYPALMEWMAAAPGISVHLTAAPEGSVVSGVLSGAFDVGVVADAQGSPRLAVETLGAEPLDLILPRDWNERLPSFEDLQSLGYIQHPDGSNYADAVLGVNFESDYQGAERLRVRSFVNQIGQIPEPVAGGLGYSILPRSGILAFQRREQLIVARFPKPIFLQLKLLEPKRRTRSARIQKLVNLIRREAGKLD